MLVIVTEKKEDGMTDGGFQFKKGTQSTTKRITWDVRAKVRALQLVGEGNTATVAIAKVAEEFKYDISQTPSYTTAAGSHIGRFRTEIKKALSNPSHKSHTAVVAACAEFGLELEPSVEVE